MKARPRRIEREVAKYLTEVFGEPFERIPVLGRTGPDLSVNHTRLVIDVKSRLSIPKGIYPPNGQLTLFGVGGLVGCRLADLACIHTIDRFCQMEPYKCVQQFYAHMDQWRAEQLPDGITALVLHRPGMKIAGALFVIHSQNLGEIQPCLAAPQPT
ncbi:MAG TPA: hypothetical protein VFF68_01040 [Anaerolineaceae bacterium]|nr:hypothetical protein [Anaerolineaceae bacterium]